MSDATKNKASIPAECDICLRPIIWGRDEKGTDFPLDPKVPVFYVSTYGAEPYNAKRAFTAHVPHAAVCSSYRKKSIKEKSETLRRKTS